MPVGCGNDCFAHPEAVGQRAGCHLRFPEVGRNVHIAHRDEVEQDRLIDELIEKSDIFLDAERSRARHETFAVGLPFAPNEIGMSRAEHDIHRIGTAFQDGRHGIDHHFDALVWRQQAECQDDGSAREA